MRRSRLAIVGAAVGLLGLAVALSVSPGGATGRAAAAPGSGARPAPRPTESRPVAVELPRRDVFRYADEPAREPARDGEAAAAPPRRAEPVPTPPPGPRLVGLVRRGGRLVAALALAGEVELAGPGESAAGVTVLGVDEDGARVRRPDGSETTLHLE